MVHGRSLRKGSEARGQNQLVQAPCGRARDRVSSACHEHGGRAVGHLPGPRAVLCQTQHPGEDTDMLAGAVQQPF